MSVVRAEWVKFRSLRSVLWAGAIVLALMAGLGALFSLGQAHAYLTSTDPDRGFDPTAASLSGILLAQIAVGVLGVLAVTSEFASGSIRGSLTAVPVRPRLLAAKAVTVTGVALVIGWIGGLAAFLLGQLVIDGQGAPAASLSDAGVPRALLGAGLYLTLTALIGLAVGAMIRSTAGALTIVIVVMLAVPIFSSALPEDIARWIAKWWPSMAGLRVMNTTGDPAALGPWAGFTVLAAFAAVVLAASFAVFDRRDT